MYLNTKKCHVNICLWIWKNFFMNFILYDFVKTMFVTTHLYTYMYKFEYLCLILRVFAMKMAAEAKTCRHQETKCNCGWQMMYFVSHNPAISVRLWNITHELHIHLADYPRRLHLSTQSSLSARDTLRQTCAFHRVVLNTYLLTVRYNMA